MSTSKEKIEVEFDIDIKKTEKKLKDLEKLTERIKRNSKFGLDSRGNTLSDRRKINSGKDSIRIDSEIKELKKILMANKNLPAIVDRSVVASGSVKSANPVAKSMEDVKMELVTLNTSLTTKGSPQTEEIKNQLIVLEHSLVSQMSSSVSRGKPQKGKINFDNMSHAERYYGDAEEVFEIDSNEKTQKSSKKATSSKGSSEDIGKKLSEINENISSGNKANEKNVKGATEERKNNKKNNKKTEKAEKEATSSNKRMLSTVQGMSRKFSKMTAMLREASFYKQMVSSSYNNLIKFGNFSAEAERNVFRTKGFKSSLSGSGVLDFEESADLMSRVSGLNKYESSSRLAEVGGLLQSSDIEIGNGVMRDFVETVQRLSISTGSNFEDASVKALAIMKGRTGANMGVAGFKRTSNSPEVILKELLEFQKKNRTTDLAMKENTLTTLMQSISSAPGGMISKIIDEYGDLISVIFEPISGLTDLFFDDGIFARLFATVGESIEKIKPESVERMRNVFVGITSLLSKTLPPIVDNLDNIIILTTGSKFGAVGLALSSLLVLFKELAEDENSNVSESIVLLTTLFDNLSYFNVAPLDLIITFFEETVKIIDTIVGFTNMPLSWLNDKMTKERKIKEINAKNDPFVNLDAMTPEERRIFDAKNKRLEESVIADHKENAKIGGIYIETAIVGDVDDLLNKNIIFNDSGGLM